MSEQIEDVVAESADSAPVRPGVGAQLRAAREALGMPIADAAAALKLGVRQLEALEEGDWKVLPGVTFVRGFIRNYARIVHLDPLPLMRELEGVLEQPASRLGEADITHVPMPSSGRAGVSRRDRVVILVGGGLVLLAALVYSLIPSDLSSLRLSLQGLVERFSHKEVPAETVVAPAPNDPVFPPGSTPQQVMNPQALVPAPEILAPTSVATPAAEQGERRAAAVIAPTGDAAISAAASPIRFVFDKESWVEVRDRSDKVIFSQRGAAGSEQGVPSGEGPFSLTVGYAAGVRVFWRGQAVDLAPHTRGDVARLVLE